MAQEEDAWSSKVHWVHLAPPQSSVGLHLFIHVIHIAEVRETGLMDRILSRLLALPPFLPFSAGILRPRSVLCMFHRNLHNTYDRDTMTVIRRPRKGCPHGVLPRVHQAKETGNVLMLHSPITLSGKLSSAQGLTSSLKGNHTSGYPNGWRSDPSLHTQEITS